MSAKFTDDQHIQDELLAAYHNESQQVLTLEPESQKQAASSNGADFVQNEPRVTMPENAPAQEFQSKISNSIEAARNALNMAIEGAEQALVYQFEQWQEMQRILEQERRIMSEVYGVNVPGDSLAAIVQLRLDRRAKAEAALSIAKQEFEQDMERRKMEFQMRQETFEERCRQWESDFLLKCQHWEDEMAHRQDTFNDLERELDLRNRDHEALWVSRSEELDQAYQSRIQELEEKARERETRISQDFAEKQRKLEEEWSFRQTRWEEEVNEYQEQLRLLQDQLREKTEEISRVNTRVLDLVSRKDITERLGAMAPQRATNPSGSRIVRPLKVQSKRAES